MLYNKPPTAFEKEFTRRPARPRTAGFQQFSLFIPAIIS
jgi:hypothetical protein